MDPVHLHLLVNHFPLIGTICGFIVLGAGFLFAKKDFKTAAYGLFIITALLAVPAYLSGESAEEAVEKTLPAVSEDLIEEHEEFASIAIWLIEALGVLAALTLVLSIKGKAAQKTFSIITLLFSVIVICLMAMVNNTGGEIIHTEIRKTNGANFPDRGSADETEFQKVTTAINPLL